MGDHVADWDDAAAEDGGAGKTQQLVYTPGVYFDYRPIEKGWVVNTLEEVDFLSPPTKRGSIPTLSLAPFAPSEYFAVRFVGRLQTEQPGLYTFYVNCDDGGVLLINGARV